MVADAAEKILILAANPINQPQLRLDQEAREIRDGLRRTRKDFVVEHQWAARPLDLRRALLDCNPTYVHFCGHGAGAAGLVLEGQFVGADALAALFALFSRSVKCVVLNACYSSIQAHAIVQHIDYVVGMSKAIGDAAAIEFSAAFYDALGAGESVKFAFDYGCTAIQLAGIPEHLTPQLLVRGAPPPPGDPVPPASPPPPEPRPRAPRRDWDGAPAVSQLFGREADAEVLRGWIIQDSCRVVLITGLGGVGKTDLVTCLGRGGNQSRGTSPTLAAGIHGDFETVMWRSLLNAPPPEVLFGEMVEVLSDHQRAVRPSFDQQIDDLLRCLDDRHCLVILDNVEAILQPGDPEMRYRPGFEAYGAFFERVAKAPHQSCLLLTSREKPRSIADLEGIRKPVRSFALVGIGVAECRALFEQIDTFRGTPEDWERIVRVYNGNPLALELVARHIAQVFDGDLGKFLGMGRPVFADLEQLLDWHLDRLSPEERELVSWLAVERVPVNPAELADDLVSPASRRNMTSTLQHLQRRIPLERAGNGHFTLQPVLIEHVTARLVDEVAAGLERALAAAAEGAGAPGAAPRLHGDLLPLNTYALVKTTAKEHVRESQRRLVLAPVADRMARAHGPGLKAAVGRLLDAWRREPASETGYVAGNLVNLLSFLDLRLQGLDFSRLPVWHACLHDVQVHSADFSFCDFRRPTFRHPFGTVFSVCYSADGAALAVGDDNGEVSLFSTRDGEFMSRFGGHAGAVSNVAFSPDGQTIASASYDNTIRVWSARDRRCTNVLLGHQGWVFALAFSPDGQTLASVSEDGTCRLWDLRTGAWASPRIDDTGFLWCVAFSPDGRLLAVAGGSPRIHLFRLPELETPFRSIEHGARVRAMAFAPDGELLASGGDDRSIHLWRPSDGARVATLPGHSDAVTALSFSSLGDLLASGSVDETVRLWSTAHRECVGQLRVSSARVWAVQCSPTDRTLTTGSDDGAVRMWNLDTCECLTTLQGYTNKTWSVAFTPRRSLLLAGNDDGLARTWNVQEARADLELRGHASRIWAVAGSPDGRWAASGSDDLTVRVWDLHSGVCRHVLRGHTDWIRALAFDPASQRLASAAEDGRAIVWDVARGTEVARMEGTLPRVLLSVSFCDEGRCLAVGGAGPVVHLFSPADGSPVGELAGHAGWVRTVTVPDAAGSTLASCSEDGTVRVWDLAARACTATLDVGAKAACGAFCDGGKGFVSGGADGFLRRWSLETGACEAAVQAHQGWVRTLAVSPAGGTVASAGDEGGIWLWRLPALTPYPTVGTLRPARPYEGMNFTGATGLTPTQRQALFALGAISLPPIE